MSYGIEMTTPSRRRLRSPLRLPTREQAEEYGRSFLTGVRIVAYDEPPKHQFVGGLLDFYSPEEK